MLKSGVFPQGYAMRKWLSFVPRGPGAIRAADWSAAARMDVHWIEWRPNRTGLGCAMRWMSQQVSRDDVIELPMPKLIPTMVRFLALISICLCASDLSTPA